MLVLFNELTSTPALRTGAQSMTIPWLTAWHLAKKLLPVVIDNAPELLKTFERFRPAPSQQDVAPSDPAPVALQKQVEAHQRTIATQAETIMQLQTTLSAAQRSATVARIILAVTILFSVTIVLYLLSRS
jgi:hypothetical protein